MSSKHGTPHLRDIKHGTTLFRVRSWIIEVDKGRYIRQLRLHSLFVTRKPERYKLTGKHQAWKIHFRVKDYAYGFSADGIAEQWYYDDEGFDADMGILPSGEYRTRMPGTRVFTSRRRALRHIREMKTLQVTEDERTRLHTGRRLEDRLKTVNWYNVTRFSDVKTGRVPSTQRNESTRPSTSRSGD